MKYNCTYEVLNEFVDGRSIKWRNTGNGEYIIATKDGQKYFVKRNMHARYPSKDQPTAVYAKYKAEADLLTEKQKRLRNLMSGLDWRTDYIVAEKENFWDKENMFTTVTPCVPDALDEKFDYSVLSQTEFVKLTQRVAEALVKLHGRGVIHGDLKGKNILVTKNSGEYTPYIIDFDSSYPSDSIPEWEGIGGSEGYQSPEVILYGADEGAADSSTITNATDIFSLGVVMHKWWVNSFPGFDLERGSVGAAVYLDRAVTIDKKFNVRIGENCGATLVSLINWMFAKDPADRPTAIQVVEVLEDKTAVPEKFHKGKDEKPFDAELWDVHKLVAELLPVSELKKLGVKSLKRLNDGTGSTGLKYHIITDIGVEEKITVTELCNKGYARSKSAHVDKPWEEHMIEFESADVIAKKGYAKIQKKELSFRKRYLITTVSGLEYDKGEEWLIQEGLAHKKAYEIIADTPWPEHGSAYNFDAMAPFQVKSISRVTIGGEHRYKIVYNIKIDGKDKVNEKVPVNNLKLMGFII